MALLPTASPTHVTAPESARATRVAHAVHSGGFYGAERVICDLMRAQAERAAPGDARPCLLAFLDAGQASNEVADRVEALGLDVLRLPTPRGLSFAGLRAYAHLLRRAGIGLLHSHGYKPTLYHMLSRKLRLHDLPLLVTAHGYPKGSGNWKATLYRLLDLRMLGRAEGVAAVSGEMRDYLSARNPACRVLTIPNGIAADLRLSGSRPLARALSGGAGPVIGSAGRLVPMKNHALLIRAYARVRRERPCRLAIVGDGPLRAELEALWRELIPDEPPRLFPFQSDVLDWMADMDVFALPSNDGEGLPMALLEAGLLERAVVCSQSGGMPEVIQDGRNGRMFGIGDLEGLSAALLDLLSDPGKRASYGRELRREVLDGHDIRVTHKLYQEAYARILANR